MFYFIVYQEITVLRAAAVSVIPAVVIGGSSLCLRILCICITSDDM